MLYPWESGYTLPVNATRHPGPIFETLEELKTREAEEWPFCQNRDFDDLVYESYRPTRPRLPSQRGIHGI